MTTVAVIKTKPDMPYQLPLRLKVVEVGERKTYMAGNQEREFRPVVLGDATGAIRLNMYDLQPENLLTEGRSVLLRGYIVRSEVRSQRKYLVATNVTRVFTTGEVAVPQEVVQEAHAILHPPPAPYSLIRDAKRMPVKTLVSVRGQIISEELPQVRLFGGSNVRVKNIGLKDDTDKCKVSLWRELVDSAVVSGDFVEVTNVVVTNFPRNEVSLSTTTISEIRTTEQPEEEKVLMIEGFEEDDNEMALCVSIQGEFIEDQFLVPTALIRAHFDLEDDIIGLNDLIPVQVNVMVQGQRIRAFV